MAWYDDDALFKLGGQQAPLSGFLGAQGGQPANQPVASAKPMAPAGPQAVKPAASPAATNRYGAAPQQSAQQKPAAPQPQYASTVLNEANVVKGQTYLNQQGKVTQDPDQLSRAYLNKQTGYGITSQRPNLLGYLDMGSKGAQQNQLNNIVSEGSNPGGQYSKGESVLDAALLSRFAPDLSVDRAAEGNVNYLQNTRDQLGKIYSTADYGKLNNAADRAGAVAQGSANAKNQSDYDRKNFILNQARSGDIGATASALSENLKGGAQSNQALLAKDAVTKGGESAGTAFDEGVASAKAQRTDKINQAATEANKYNSYRPGKIRELDTRLDKDLKALEAKYPPEVRNVKNPTDIIGLWPARAAQAREYQTEKARLQQQYELERRSFSGGNVPLTAEQILKNGITVTPDMQLRAQFSTSPLVELMNKPGNRAPASSVQPAVPNFANSPLMQLLNGGGSGKFFY